MQYTCSCRPWQNTHLRLLAWITDWLRAKTQQKCAPCLSSYTLHPVYLHKTWIVTRGNRVFGVSLGFHRHYCCCHCCWNFTSSPNAVCSVFYCKNFQNVNTGCVRFCVIMQKFITNFNTTATTMTASCTSSNSSGGSINLMSLKKRWIIESLIDVIKFAFEFFVVAEKLRRKKNFFF